MVKQCTALTNDSMYQHMTPLCTLAARAVIEGMNATRDEQ